MTQYQLLPTFNSKRKYRLWMHSSEVRLTLLSLAWFLFGTYIVCIANAYLDHTNPSLELDIDQRQRLPDPLLEHLAPYYKEFNFPTGLSDVLARLAPLLFFTRCFLMGNRTLLVLRRVFYILGTSYLFRTPFILMTVLPNPLVTCIPKPDPHLLYDALLLMAQRRASCGDVLYSGHTIMFMFVALTWIEYPPKSQILSNLCSSLAILYTLFGIIVLISSTYHYTVDCVIGVIMVLILWRGYHFIVTTHYCDQTWYSQLLLYCDGERYIRNISPEIPYELCDDVYP